MNEESTTSAEMEEYYRQSRRPLIPRPTTPLARFGCGVVLVIWFAILLMPFAMFWLGSGRTITIPQGNIPDASDHPYLEVRLVMDADNRGLQIKQAGVAERRDEQLCIEERVTYLLWQSEENSGNALYCQCYERENAEAEWALSGTTDGRCEDGSQ
ncbi:MAG: hypothetical protein KC496_10965 [Anaerolineae bacterium]|nr:hypothetical protein [Anaerolineae bacterium]